MTDWRIGLLALAGAAFLTGSAALLARPSGPRVVRYARAFLAAHPGAAAGDLRAALRERFLGGVRRRYRPADAVALPLLWLVERALEVAEGVRDRWFPPDRDAIGRRIEAAIQIVAAPPSGPGGASDAGRGT